MKVNKTLYGLIMGLASGFLALVIAALIITARGC